VTVNINKLIIRKSSRLKFKQYFMIAMDNYRQTMKATNFNHSPIAVEKLELQ
jgi:hypothetical protein